MMMNNKCLKTVTYQVLKFRSQSFMLPLTGHNKMLVGVDLFLMFFLVVYLFHKGI